jgi:hypothetical protein
MQLTYPGALMPKLFAIAAIIGAVLLIADTLYAQNPPWCAIMDNDGNTQCSYYSQQECLQTLSGIGGECIRNPAGNAPNDGQRRDFFAPFSGSSENAQGLRQLQSQDPGPPPGLGGVPPPPNN